MSIKDCPCQIKVVSVTADTLVSVEALTESAPIAACSISTENEYSLDAITEHVIKKGYSPYIGETGTWWEYDDNLHAFINTNVNAGQTPIAESVIAAMWSSIGEEDE